MKKTILLALLAASLPSFSFAQTCSSIRFMKQEDGWRTMQSAPRDGTVIEFMETFGIAPWYDLYRWAVVESGSSARWVNSGSSGRAGNGVGEDSCLFWRPYKGNPNAYHDPTNGEQNSTSYWCAAMGLPFNPRTGYCERRK